MVRFTGHKARLNDTGLAQTVTHDCAFQGKEVMEFCDFPGSFKKLRTVDVAVVVQTAEFPQVAQLDDVRGFVYS